MKNFTSILGVALATSLLVFELSAAAEIKSAYGPAGDYACGIEIVEKATAFKENRDFAGGEAFLAAQRAKGFQSREMTQCLEMATFALYREEKSKDAEMNAILKHVVDQGETTFWGTAALGWMHVRGINPISVYWPWRKGQLIAPETKIVYGVDQAFAREGHYVISITGEAPLKVTALTLVSTAGAETKLASARQLPRVTIFEADIAEPKSVSAIKIATEGENLPAGRIDIQLKLAKKRAAVNPERIEGIATDAAKYIRATVGEKTIEEIAAKDGGEKFLSRFLYDNDWMEQFAGSGPWSDDPHQGVNENLPNAALALKALDMLVFNDKDDFILGSNTGRNFATALALTHGYDKDDDWLVDVLSCYREWVKDGSLIPQAKYYDARQWREVLGFGQNAFLPVEALRWSHGFVAPLKDIHDYHSMCWQCSYRTYNCFGESVQGPFYYRAWEHRLHTQAGRYYVGGVCGGLSKFGSHIAAAHGVRTVTAGQPQHCAYVVWDYSKGRWDIAYSVTGHTVPHNTLGGIGFAAKTEQERYYSHPRRMEAERLRWRGEYEKAMRLVPGNWTAAVAWFNALNRQDASHGDWQHYCTTVRETFRDMPSEAYQLTLPYIRIMPSGPERIEFMRQALMMVVESPTDEVEEAYLEEIVLNPIKDIFRNEPEAVWSLFESALDGQSATRTFFRQAVNWGAANLITDEATTGRYLATIGRNVRKTGAKLDYREMLIKASRNADLGFFREVYALMDKCSPELKTTPNGRKWPSVKAGAQLLSADGMLMSSSTSPWDWPISYRDALNAEGHVELSSFHTGKETSPWGMVKLPGPAEVKAITIVNSGGGVNAERQLPLVVWASEDGKNFTRLATFRNVQPEWNLELTVPVKARYVKVGREPNAKTEYFHLHKILVYGKKLY